MAVSVFWVSILKNRLGSPAWLILVTQGFLSSVKWVIVAFKVCDLDILFVCTRAVVSYMGILIS